MICYYRNSNSCGANRREFEDQSAIKGKFEQNGIRPSWSLILGRTKRRVKKRGEEKKKIRRRGRREERYGILWFCMETICVWNLYGSVCMDVSSSISRV